MTRRRALAAVVLVVVTAATLAACGGGSSSKATSADLVEGAGISPASPLLRSRSRLQRQARDAGGITGEGRAATFLYTHCPDVCPLIAGNLRVVQNQLKDKAKDVVVLAVSTDPRGDTPRNVAKFLRIHRMTGRMDYLMRLAAGRSPPGSEALEHRGQARQAGSRRALLAGLRSEPAWQADLDLSVQLRARGHRARCPDPREAVMPLVFAHAGHVLIDLPIYLGAGHCPGRLAEARELEGEARGRPEGARAFLGPGRLR